MCDSKCPHINLWQVFDLKKCLNFLLCAPFVSSVSLRLRVVQETSTTAKRDLTRNREVGVVKESFVQDSLQVGMKLAKQITDLACARIPDDLRRIEAL